DEALELLPQRPERRLVDRDAPLVHRLEHGLQGLLELLEDGAGPRLARGAGAELLGGGVQRRGGGRQTGSGAGDVLRPHLLGLLLQRRLGGLAGARLEARPAQLARERLGVVAARAG